MKQTTILLKWSAVVVGFSIVYWLLPFRVSPYQDFSVLYYTNKALLSGISIYDLPAQLKFIEQVTPAGFEFHPFPYPPWFAVLSLPLAFFEPQTAAKAWSLVNILMVAASVSLMTIDWKPFQRSLALITAFFFTPTLGLILVGQYSAILLLGLAMLITFERREHVPGVVLGLLLLTFKPHIGAFLFVAAFIWLFLNKPNLGKKAAYWAIGGLMALGLIGIAADRQWVTHYFGSMLRYTSLNGVASCGKCASLTGIFLQGASAYAVGIGMIFLSIFLLLKTYPEVFKDLMTTLSMVAMLVLLFLPYILLYDFILLILPWLLMLPQRRSLYFLSVITYFVLRPGLAGRLTLACLALALLVLYLKVYIDRRPYQV